MATVADIIQRGTRAGQPAATAVSTGTLYYVTDENVTERSNGTTWDDVTDAGGAAYTDEQAQDAVGTILTDTATVDLVYTDATPKIEANVIPGGIKLDDLGAPDDNTDRDVSTSAHGLVPKITGSDGYSLQKSGTAAVWAAGGGGGDSSLTSVYGSRPAASNDGDLFLPSDGFYLERDTGSAWSPWGPIYPMTAPVDGDFAWINQGGASVDTTFGGIHLSGPATAPHSLRIRKKAAPSTPYTITAIFKRLMDPRGANSSGHAGVCFRQSSDGKLHSLSIWNGAQPYDLLISSSKWTSATAFSAHYVITAAGGTFLGPVFFLRIADNGTNRIVSFSTDGQHFIDYNTIGRTDFLTADEVGFYVSGPDTTYAMAMTLLSWKEA